MHATHPPEALQAYPAVITLPVQWGDQDLFGHVNNTIPIRWFESSRIAYFEQSGVDAVFREIQLGPILASVTCHYRRQLFYPDTVWVGSRVTRLGRTSIAMSHALYSQRQDALVADGDCVMVVFDYHRHQPEPIPAPLREALTRFEGHALDS